MDDGEIVGYAGPQADWRPQTADEVDWTLGRRAEIEAELTALRLREEAVAANFSRLRKEKERKLAGWDWRFRADVVAFARKALDGGKSRTLQMENGAVRFRTTQGTNRITDPDAAVAFVESVRPGAVKVSKSVTVKAVLEAAAESGAARPTIAHFLHSTGPSESVAIETGVDG